MSDVPPASAWRQSLNILLDEEGRVGTYGYEPRLWHTGPQINKTQIQANKLRSQEMFRKRTGKGMPDYWPLHADGMLVTHLYRLIEEYEA